MPDENNFNRESLELLGRLDERTKAIQLDITNIRLEIRDHKESIQGLDKKFVRNESFQPVQRIVYGVVGLIMTAVLVAILGLIILK